MSKRVLNLFSLSILIIFAMAAVASAQKAEARDKEEKEIVLEFKTQLVLVPFSALDRTNHPVGDLKAEDVKLFENGQPAQILSLQRSGSQSLNFALLLDLSGS